MALTSSGDRFGDERSQFCVGSLTFQSRQIRNYATDLVAGKDSLVNVGRLIVPVSMRAVIYFHNFHERLSSRSIIHLDGLNVSIKYYKIAGRIMKQKARIRRVFNL